MTYALGFDIGTSKIACVILRSETGELVAISSYEHRADIPLEPFKGEQSVTEILKGVDLAMRSLPAELLSQVSVIGVAGQMHGVVFWNDGTRDTSTLVSWQDRRCSEENFLEMISRRLGEYDLRDGYGCATLAWFQKYQPETLAQYQHAATIHDYFVALICGLEKAVTDPTDAASWGLFDVLEGTWETSKIKLLEIPDRFLPEVKPSGMIVGQLTSEFASRWNLKPGTSVMNAIGDNQASLTATLRSPNKDIGLTMGTGGQLAVVFERTADLTWPISGPVEVRPFPGNRFAAVAASLCGGNAFVWIVEAVRKMIEDLGLPAIERETLFRQLNDLGMESTQSSLRVGSSFMGERHDRTRRGSIENVDLENFTLGNITAALTRDIVTNLKNMMPEKFLRGKIKVVGSGNGMRRLPLMQRAVEEVFGLPLSLTAAQEEAATGAALLALETTRQLRDDA